MPAAHELVVEAHVGILTAPEGNRPLREGNLLELGLGVQDYKVRTQLNFLEFDCLARGNDGLV
jgi:hypothetical protein